jgi:hypothetical protein
MPICLGAPEETAAEQKREPEWREPPGMLGEYVRRVKQLTASPADQRVAAARPERSPRP